MSVGRETDCLIIGGGIAGLSTASRLADRGKRVTVIVAGKDLSQCNSYHAQGGIIYEALSHNPQSLKQDIQEAGCHINYEPAVDQLVEAGPELVRRVLLDKAHVEFDRDAEGEWLRTREGAHSENRILHRGDESGKAIQSAMIQLVGSLENVEILTEHTAVNLLMTSFHSTDRSRLHEPARCFGAFVYDQTAKRVDPVFARHTVLATGGIGQLFLHNTNSKFSRGDGIALAHRAGCRLENLEYVQFHPTTFYHPKSTRFLISEALRGEGAVLINDRGERFAKKYLTEYEVPELAPRDRVAQAIHQEILSTGAPCVYLDISHKDADWIRERFPFVYGSCLKVGVDITREPIPVLPGAHYHCGGVWVDLEARTTIPSLWAVGEVSCTGVHGANRLASTSLLEGLVWGVRAADAIASDLGSCAPLRHPQIYPWQAESAVADPSFLHQDWLMLKHTMWNYVGLIKTDSRLKRAEGILGELSEGIDNFYRRAALSDELIGLRQAVLVSQLILNACKRNHKSKGCYLRGELEI
ncbi:MAG: FAD-dependent oxidoreductase [Bdellovibrionales bacterium]|nr:FAD-dependent oxidoreductase [Bdellovibrionales bacterium]